MNQKSRKTKLEALKLQETTAEDVKVFTIKSLQNCASLGKNVPSKCTISPEMNSCVLPWLNSSE